MGKASLVLFRPSRSSTSENEFLPYSGAFNNLRNFNYLYGGEKFGGNLYDSKARFQANTGAFLSQDPLAEKYYGISPYSYCAGNLVNMVDPEGKDIWELHQDGTVHFVEKNERNHILYATNKNGDRINKSLSFRSDFFPKALSNVNNGVSKVELNKSEYKEGVALFLFAADNTSVEWTFHAGEEMVVVGTLHDRDNVGSYTDFGFTNRPLISIHSYPGPFPTKEDWLFSVGLVSNPENSKVMDVLSPSDVYNVRNHPDKKADKNFVYFPDLKGVIQLFPNREPTEISNYLDVFRKFDFQYLSR